MTPWSTSYYTNVSAESPTKGLWVSSITYMSKRIKKRISRYTTCVDKIRTLPLMVSSRGAGDTKFCKFGVMIFYLVFQAESENHIYFGWTWRLARFCYKCLYGNLFFLCEFLCGGDLAIRTYPYPPPCHVTLSHFFGVLHPCPFPSLGDVHLE